MNGTHHEEPPLQGSVLSQYSQHEEPPVRRRNYVGFFLLGLFDVTPFIVILSASDDMARSFGYEDYLATFLFSIVIFGLCLRLANAFKGFHYSFRSRFVLVVGMNLTGCVCLALASSVGDSGLGHFVFAVFGATLIGGAYLLGESLGLAYTKLFSATVVSAWSTGTGFAGITGALLYLALQAGNLTYEAVFLLQIPFALVFGIAGLFILKPEQSGHEPPVTLIDADEGAAPLAEPFVIANGETVVEPPNTAQAAKVRPGHRMTETEDQLDEVAPGRFQVIHKVVFFYSANILASFILEYATIFATADAFPCWVHNSTDWLDRHAFPVGHMCYRCGAFLGRFSIHFFSVPAVDVISATLLALTCLWLIQGSFLFIVTTNGFFVLFATLFVIGFLAGLSYANIYYHVKKEHRLPKHEKETAMNIVSMYSSLGKLLASVFDIIFASAVLRRECGN